MIGALQGARRAVQRQLSLRRGGAAATCCATPAPRRSSTTPASRRCFATVLPKLPPMALLLQVDDGSGEPLLPGARDYEQALAARERRAAAGRRRATTTSTSSTPAARPACRRACCGARTTSSSPPWAAAPRRHGPVDSIDEMVERAPRARCIRALPAPPFMHGAAHWVGVHHPAPGRHRSSCRATPARSTPTTSGAPSSARRSSPCRSSATPSRGRCSISSAKATYDLSSLKDPRLRRRDPLAAVEAARSSRRCPA